MNKKGDLAVTMLFFVALFFSLYCLYAFATFDGKFESDSTSVSAMLSEAEFSQKYALASAALLGEQAIKSGGDLSTGMGMLAQAKREELMKYYSYPGNFFLNVINKDFSFSRNAQGYDLEVPNLFVKVARGSNSIKRNFNISVEFDNSGKVLSERIIS